MVGLYRPAWEEAAKRNRLTLQADDNRRAAGVVGLIRVEHDLRLRHCAYIKTINTHQTSNS